MVKDSSSNGNSKIATLVYDILAGKNSVTDLLNLITTGGQDMAALSTAMKDDNQWIAVHDAAGNKGYEISGGNARMLIMFGEVPEQYRSQIPKGAVSKYMFVSTFNANFG